MKNNKNMEQTERLKRQFDLIDPELLDKSIHIVGAGGIGSWTALLLAKMGCNDISIYDGDEVEDHNVASQFFKESQLGEDKTEALKQNIKEQTGIEVLDYGIGEEDKIEEGLVILALDSMKRRAELSKIYEGRNLYIIDARMGGLQLEVYCQPAKEYQSTIVKLEDVEPEPCTGRAISFNCAIIGGIITNYTRLYLKGELTKDKIIMLFHDGIRLLR